MKKKITDSGLPAQIQALIKKHFYFILYARTESEFNSEVSLMISYFENLNSSQALSQIYKSRIHGVSTYFQKKLAQKDRWAYIYRANKDIGTNISQERFHGLLKEIFPINGSPRVDTLIWILLVVVDKEMTKRDNFTTKPKSDNFPYRLILSNLQYKLSLNFSKFSIDGTSIELCKEYLIIEIQDKSDLKRRAGIFGI